MLHTHTGIDMSASLLVATYNKYAYTCPQAYTRAHTQTPIHTSSPWGRIDTCICTVESLQCSSETITTLLIGYTPMHNRTYLVIPIGKNPSTMQETLHCRFDSWVGKIPRGRKQQPAPVFLPGEIPWTEQPSGLQSIGLQRVGHNSANNAFNTFNTKQKLKK